MGGGLHPAAVARTTREARRGRSLLERLAMRTPGVLPRIVRATLALPPSRLRSALVKYAYRRAYAAFGRGDWELNTALMAGDDYVIRNEEVDIPDIPPIRHGVDGYLGGLDALLEAFSEMRIVFEGSVEIDRDRSAALIHFVGVGSGSGVPVDQPVLDVHEFENGRVVRQTTWWQRDAGLRALGQDAQPTSIARSGLHPAAVARTTPEARRGRSLLERLAVRFPALIRPLIRLLFRLPASPLRRAGLEYMYRRGYAAWNRRDWELNTVAHDPQRYELVWPEGDRPPGARSSYEGIDGYLEFAELWLDSFGDYRFELEEVGDPGGNRLGLLIRQIATGRSSGAALVERMASVDEYEGGRMVRQTVTTRDPLATLRAHGLEPRSS